MEKIVQNSSIEQIANYEGNESVLLFSRLRNPVIREQLVEFIHSVESESQDGNTRTKDQIEKDIEAKINQIENSTNITYADLESHPYHTADRMVIGYIDPFTKSELTVKQTSMVEAHEKGHVVRSYSGTYKRRYADRLSAAFDSSHFVIPQEDLDLIEEKSKDSDEPFDIDSVKRWYVAYLLDPSEIVERMSQLKNYFGFSGDEVFTLEHLKYAREHYIKDVGTSNGMSGFFSIITPDTENEFIRIINSVGI